jgi:hypothetical protein
VLLAQKKAELESIILSKISQARKANPGQVREK